MTKVNKGFKVLNVADGKLTSVIVGRGDPGSIVYKKPGEGITIPNSGCGPMLVFSDKGEASNWMQIFQKYFKDNLRIFTCEYAVSTYNEAWGAEIMGRFKKISLNTIRLDSGKSVELADEIRMLEMVM